MIDHAEQVPVALAHDMWVIPTGDAVSLRSVADQREWRIPVLAVIVSGLVKEIVAGELRSVSLGHTLLDRYLEFVAARARPNTLLAVAYDLKVFFTEVAKEPTATTTADILAFIESQRAPRRGATVVRLEDGEAGLSARTVKRRLASVSGMFDYLIARGDAGVPTRCREVWPHGGGAVVPVCGESR